MILAETIADCRSQDLYVQVGACAVLRDSSVSLGCSGPPAGCDIDWSGREKRAARMIHAEVNAVRSVAPGECKFLAVTMLPCRHCMTFIASKGNHEWTRINANRKWVFDRKKAGTRLSGSRPRPRIRHRASAGGEGD